MRVLAGRRSVFFIWLLSYVIILVLLILLSGLVYFQARTALEQEINKAKYAVLREAENAINSRISDIERMSLQIAWNPRVQGFAYLPGPLALEYHYNLTLLSRDFTVYKSAFNFVKEFFVFFGNSRLILSSDTVCDPELYYTWYAKGAASSYREWMSFLLSSHNGELMPFGDSIAYVRSLPIGQQVPANATLVILLDPGWLRSTLASLSWNPLELVFILDSKNRVLASTGEVNPHKVPAYEALGDEGVFTFRNGQATMLVSSVKSKITGWKLVSILPHLAFMERVTYLQNLTVAGLLICLVLGGVAAYLFSRRNYHFISELTRDMAALAGIRLDEGGNEYRLLKKAVAATLEQKERTDASLKRYNAALRGNFLYRLARGRFTDAAAMQDSLAGFGVRLLSPHFATFIIFVEGKAAGTPVGYERGEGWLENLILSNGIEAIAGRRHLGLVSEHDEMLVCILNFAIMQSLEWQADFRTIIEESRQFVAQETGRQVTVAAGTIHTGLESIPAAYQEALDALEYKLILGPGSVIEYESVKERRSDYQCSMETEQQLLNMIRTGNARQSEEILQTIFESNFRGGNVSVQSVKCFIFDIYNLLIKAVSGLDARDQRDLRDMLNQLLIDAAHSSLDELCGRIRSTVSGICQRIARMKGDDRLGLEIKDFVNRRHSDLNLNIAMIADHFRLSQGYISRLFREMTGESLLDYIGIVRIRRAKILMEQHGKRLNEVARAVGFGNANSFIRAFKRHEGITPGKFRDFIV